MSNTRDSAEVPQHAPMKQFKVFDNCLYIGGQSLTEIARQVGKTPFYAYDSSLMSAQVETLRAALPGGIHLHYAMKANPMPEVVRHLWPASPTDWMWHRRVSLRWHWPPG